VEESSETETESEKEFKPRTKLDHFIKEHMPEAKKL
jgi:hypothetical protein